MGGGALSLLAANITDIISHILGEQATRAHGILYILFSATINVYFLIMSGDIFEFQRLLLDRQNFLHVILSVLFILLFLPERRAQQPLL